MEMNGQLHTLMLYPQGESPRYVLEMKLFCPYQDVKSGPSAHGLVTMLTELFLK
jgi:hypothetical protein